MILAFGKAGGLGTTEATLKSRDHTFNLPALSVKLFGKSMAHLKTIAAAHRLRMSARIEREDGAGDVQCLATKSVVWFCIKGSVTE